MAALWANHRLFVQHDGEGQISRRLTILVRPTEMHALRPCAAGMLAQHLWPTERLTVDETSRRLLLEHLLSAESERGLMAQGRGTVRGFHQAHG